MHRLTTYYFDPEDKTYRTKTCDKSLGVNDVLIKTTHSGVCFTDVHAKAKACGLGHEGVGIIHAVGEAVTHLKIGDRVGWGWLHSSCGHCTTCVTGYRQYCPEARGFAFADLDQGAFGDGRIIDAAFAYRIPDAIGSLDAGPFMCAGASTYEALDAAGVGANDHVGVVGIGGLGHMAVLFAKAMGCAVTAISSGREKKDDAFGLGADEFRSLGDLTAVYRREAADGRVEDAEPMSINILLLTSNEVPDLEPILPLLARRATIVLMTIQTAAIAIPYMPFVLPGHRLIASTEASRENHIKMLEFAARHKIKPWIEAFPMDAKGVEAAFEKLESGRMRYRGVLVRQK
ncbi:alcohol dehydrogenase [Teratosphaeria destructans]|uniref:Alcohol dehydrogenase n=1 Tax=Teratosphaeria destructans TaxID=418781 RepID=A0A9W7VYJ5_9PEZI|nr:alcohol dehydrogenase [Teratosphaeria destructans]